MGTKGPDWGGDEGGIKRKAPKVERVLGVHQRCNPSGISRGVPTRINWNMKGRGKE